MKDKKVYSYINDIAQRLKDPRKYGDVSLMVGAGFSKNAQNKGVSSLQPPNWSELAEKMYNEIYPEPIEEKEKVNWEKQKIIKTSGKNVTKLADEYIANFDRNKMNNLIEESIADKTFIPGELHKRLLKLGWSDVFTTNYDTLLEQTVDLIYSENNYEIIYSQNDLPGSIKPRIIKLHGSIPQVKPYIICDEDYRTYPHKYSGLVNTVQQAMLETRLCLIGFSGDDPNFQSWLGWLRDNMGDYCPKIYLIDLFENQSDSEKKLLENRGITLVDISVFVSNNTENRHYYAISEFLRMLEKHQNENDIYLERPYSTVDIFWKPKSEEIQLYIKEMEEYSSKIEALMQPYILLPEEKREKFSKYFLDHFYVILKHIPTSSKLLLKVIKILRKCLAILSDENAELLEKLLVKEKDLHNDTLCEIYLYLAEMYRIDGKKEEFEKCIDRCEEYSLNISYYRNECIIERIKENISIFDYENALLLIDKIEPLTFELKVKKAALYKQLSKNEIAEKILSECSAELAQMKLSDEVYSSYLGYINLCHRAGNWKIIDEYSDNNYYNNPYNTRRIIVDQRMKLEQIFFEKERKKDEKVIPFGLNSSKSITMVFGGENVSLINSFVFILGIDRLCLPIFSDQSKLLPRVNEEIMQTSANVYWKLSLAARTDQEKIIDQIFTRKIMLNLTELDKNKLFEMLLKVSKLYSVNDRYDQKKYLISVNNILKILSRLSVFMADNKLVDFIEILNKFSKKDDSFIKGDFKKILDIISTRFNKYIAEACQKIIFMDFNVEYHLASYFKGISFAISEKNVDIFYSNALRLSKSEGINERDNGLACLLVLWQNNPLGKYKDEIIRSFWGKCTETLPKTDLYYPLIWEELPHPELIDFSKLYYDYLKNTSFVESVTKLGNVSNNSYGSVYNYLIFYFMTSSISISHNKKILFDEELAHKILNRSYNFIIHEKSLLEYDFMGEREECEKKFLKVSELVAYVYCEIIKNKMDSINFSLIDDIRNELKECKISTVAIDMIEMIKNEQINECIDLFENVILSKNKKNYASVFAGLQGLVYLKAKSSQSISFENFFNAIKYLDIEYSKTIWIYLTSLLRYPFFINQEAQKYISCSIKKCIDIYEELAKRGERYYLDGLYNCVVALHQYKRCIVQFKSIETEELKQCINRAKQIDNYEITNIWSD